jgi:riboflavin kinase/FMN adenylyltransferase
MAVVETPQIGIVDADEIAYTWIRNENRDQGPLHREACVALGVFDGVHLGHRSMLRAARAHAARFRLDFVVVTFDRHPRNAFGIAHATPLLQSRAECVSALFEMDADYVLSCAFTKAFAAMEPERFARFLAETVRPRRVFVGENFRFGADRGGDVDSLSRLGQTWGFDVEPFPLLAEGDQRVSSTRIRATIAAGDMKQAAALLGRAHSLTTRAVISHEGSGATFCFPPEAVRPPAGYYLARIGHTSRLPVTIEVFGDLRPCKILHWGRLSRRDLEAIYSNPVTIEFLDQA